MLTPEERKERLRAQGRAAAQRFRAAHPGKNAARQREFRQQYPDKVIASNAKYYAENRDAVLAHNRAYYRKNRRRRIDYQATKRFGVPMTLEVRTLMLAEHNGVCDSCGVELVVERTPGKFVMHVDHNHDTGEIRGVLCTRCNTGIGQFQDSIELMQRAIDYLKRATKQEHKNAHAA